MLPSLVCVYSAQNLKSRLMSMSILIIPVNKPSQSENKAVDRQ